MHQTSLQFLSSAIRQWLYSGCQKNVPIVERFFCYNTYAAILYSEHYYDNWYECLD
jgi:hypothetical protein